MGDINYSFELSEYVSALSGDQINTSPPDMSTITIDDFTEGTHFRTGTDSNNALVLKLEDRLLGIILDESGSMTWNDANKDRYTYFRRLLTKLQATYPGQINIVLLGFGGMLTSTSIFIAPNSASLSSVAAENFDQLTLSVFENSVYDFAGVRVVRRAYDEDRGDEDSSLQYPQDPNDGTIVAEGIFNSAKDTDLVKGTTYYYGVWVYNKDDHAGTPHYIRAFPYDRDLPEGVHFADAEMRVLTGIQRDDYTQLIYNFQEKEGTIIYDSSGNSRHGFLPSQTIADSFWAGDSAATTYNDDGFLKQSIGVRFDGEYDLVEVESDSSLAYIAGEQSLTVCFWAYPYASSQDMWVIGTSTREETNLVGWGIGISASGELVMVFEDISAGFTIPTGAMLATETWSHIAIVMDSSELASVYINGTLAASDIVIPSIDSTTYMLYIGAKPTSSSATWPGSDYFGLLANLSISNIIRDASFVADLYGVESPLFSDSMLEQYAAPQDNGQREVIIHWVVGTGYNFADGKVKIIRKYNEAPSHDEDGDVVLEQDASEGEFVYLDSYAFIHGADYYYRIFTYKKVSVDGEDKYLVCDRDDARLMSVYIPKIPHVSDMPSPPSVSGAVATPGDRKLLLEWVNPIDPAYRGTKIFFGEETYPTPSYNSPGVNVTNGVELIDTTGTRFVHRSLGKTSDGNDRPLRNGRPHYYTIVTYDELGVFSAPVFLQAMPSSSAVSVFEPAEITDLHVKVVNPKTLSLQWINPAIKSEVIDIYMGETALIFTSVNDIYGGKLDNISNMTYDVWAKFTERETDANTTELGYESILDEEISNTHFAGVFPDQEMDPEAKNEIVLNQSVVGTGLLKGTLTHVADKSIVARRESYTMIVRATYKVVDPETNEEVFIYHSEPVRVEFHNPTRISIVNKHNRKVHLPYSTLSSKGDASVCECPPENNQIQDRYVDGAYCNSTRPYVARVEFQYKGASVANGYPISVSIWLDREMTTKPQYTAIQEGSYPSTAIEIVDENGNVVTKNYVDVEIQVPSMPETVYLYARVDYRGFVADGLSKIVFIGALYISLDCRKPIPDGINAEEQFARVWMIHPDYPDDPSMQIQPPDGTLVKWDLQIKRYGRNRPFYSTEKISEFLSGVYSTTKNGIARNVFFGPLGPQMEKHVFTYTCDDEDIEECCLYEDYIITASTAVGELTATDQWTFAYQCDDVNKFTDQRMFINAASVEEWPDNTGNNPEWVTWADGIHMLKFKIAHNPADPDCPVPGADCFVNCVKALNKDATIFSLQPGTIVNVVPPPGSEILWGVHFYDDPYTDEVTIAYIEHIISEKIATEQGIPNIANIELGYGKSTDFYIRMNAVIDIDPHEMELPKDASNALSDLMEGHMPNEWKGICDEKVGSCSLPTSGTKWEGVSALTATTNIFVQIGDKQVETQLRGGGDYETGIPPIMVGFKEPLKAEIVNVRLAVDPYYVDLIEETDKDGKFTGRRFLPINEVVDKGYITFVVDVTFAGEPVPENVPVEIEVSGVELADCIGESAGCVVSSTGIVRTKLVNDPYINPADPTDPNAVPQKSIAYFTINEISSAAAGGMITIGDTQGSSGYIIAWVDYDKRGDLGTGGTST